MNALKSIGAVVAGIASNFLAVPVDAALHATGVFPPLGVEMADGLLAVALSYRLVFALLGGFVTAKLAPQSPIKHALILGCIGIALSTLGTVAMWDMGHHWYPISLIVISLPCSWAGAKFATKR